MNKNNAFIGLCLGLSMAFQVHAQKPVAAPMKDVNQVIDNTLDSLNKARTARPVPGSSRKGNNRAEVRLLQARSGRCGREGVRLSSRTSQPLSANAHIR